MLLIPPAIIHYLLSHYSFSPTSTNGNFFAVSKPQGEKRWQKRIIWNGGATKK